MKEKTRQRKNLKKPKSAVPKTQMSNRAYKTKIMMIGIGGGGNSIVSAIAPHIKKASFVVADSDCQALKETPRKVKQFRFGQDLTKDSGTGMNPELGEEIARNEKERIKQLLAGTDFCILLSCLGGGMGSGASPIFAEISKKLSNITLGIFTLPFEFEGEKKMEIAKSSLDQIKPNLNASVILSNQKLFNIINKNTPFKEAFSIVNHQVAEILEGLIEMLYSSGFISIDLADLKATLGERGKLAFLNTIKADLSERPHQNTDSGDKSVQEIARKAVYNRLSPYLAYKAKRILFNITGGENLSLNEVNQIGSIISRLINPRDKTIFGITQNKEYENKIKITLLATGCKWEDYNPPTTSPHSSLHSEGALRKKRSRPKRQ